MTDKPRIFFGRGLWHCVKWPHIGHGLTPWLAWMNFHDRKSK